MNEVSDNILLEQELHAHKIVQNDDGSFRLDDSENMYTCTDILDKMKSILSDYKKDANKSWKDLKHLSEIMISEPEYNEVACLDNLLFINYVDKVYSLSLIFDELDDTSKSIKKLMDTDISHINHEFITQFNDCCIEVRVLHCLIMREIYRTKIVKRYLSMNKTASVAGPWSHLDLPMQERMWDGSEDSEDAEYMENRTNARKSQSRYNPESNFFGIYLEWRDENRNPYRFGDDDESPYPSRNQLKIP